MDGGIDLVISSKLADVESAVQGTIVENYHGEMPVGMAEVVPSYNDKWPYLVCAPTMRVPQDISNTVNAYLAFRAALLAIAQSNKNSGIEKIESVIVPGLGTGVGRLKPSRCATQMRMAYDSVLSSGHIPSFRHLQSMHINLLTA